SAASRTIPVIRFSQNPIHITLKNFSMARTGIWRAMPSSRRSNAQLNPTRIPMPVVCRVRMSGYAQIEPEPRIQVQNSVFSSQVRNSIDHPQSASRCNLGPDERRYNFLKAEAREDGYWGWLGEAPHIA